MAKIFRYVNPISEISILIAVALFSFYMAIVHKRNILITYFQLLLQLNIRVISNRISEKIFFFTCLIFAFIVASLHQSHIIESLTDRTIAQSISSRKDLVNSDLKIVLDYTHYKALKYVDKYGRDELIRRAEINPNFDDCISRLGNGEHVACISTDTVVKSGIDTFKKQLIANKKKITGHPYIIHTGKFSLSTLIVRRGFPYLHKFEIGDFKLHQFGLLKKWQTNTHVNHFKLPINQEFDGALRLSHFKGFFSLVAICTIIANAVFIGEIIVHHIKSKRIK